MKNGQRKAVISHQIKMREVNVNVDGSAATPAASGFDKSQIKEVIDNGVGSWTIVLKMPFNKDNANSPQAQVQSLTADVVFHVSAVDYDRVTVQGRSVGTSTVDPAAADGDFAVRILGCDHRFNY